MIYLDGSATTKPYQDVVNTIVDVLENHWGNASADYSFGYDAKEIINNVTTQVANDINCKPSEIIWTSGACEANSLAILGTAHRYYTWLYTSKLEHASIHEIAKNFESINEGNYCNIIENDKHGFISLQDLKKQLDSNKHNDTHRILVSISFANSEIGTVQDIKAISEIVHKYDGILHVDATQLYPWKKIDVQKYGIDMMSVSGQKLHCVKGIGFLYVKDGLEFNPLIYGSQQNGKRGGTYSTHLIAAFGKALEITRKNNACRKVEILRNQLIQKLVEIPGTYFNGAQIGINKLPNNISMTVNGVNAEEIVSLCDDYGIMIAKGSACQSYKATPSNTLLAIGLSEEQALSTIRITLDENNTIDDIEEFTKIIKDVITILRKY